MGVITLEGNFYNLIHGENKHANVILKSLNLTRDKCGRFRDCYLKDNKIVVYTRLGGFNRKAWASTIKTLQKHPLYLSDADDTFDDTFASFYFKIPTSIKKLIGKSIKEEKLTPAQKTVKTLEDMKNKISTPTTKKVKKVLGGIMAQIEAAEFNK